MLVLSRKLQESIVLDGRITITIVEVRGNQVRLGIEAPRDVAIRRQELIVGRDSAGLPATGLTTSSSRGPSSQHASPEDAALASLLLSSSAFGADSFTPEHGFAADHGSEDSLTGNWRC